MCRCRRDLWLRFFWCDIAKHALLIYKMTKASNSIFELLSVIRTVWVWLVLADSTEQKDPQNGSDEQQKCRKHYNKPFLLKCVCVPFESRNNKNKFNDRRESIATVYGRTEMNLCIVNKMIEFSPKNQWKSRESNASQQLRRTTLYLPRAREDEKMREGNISIKMEMIFFLHARCIYVVRLQTDYWPSRNR